MIIITDTSGYKHYIHPDAIASIREAGPNWSRIGSYVKLFDKSSLEAQETPALIIDQMNNLSDD